MNVTCVHPELNQEISLSNPRSVVKRLDPVIEKDQVVYYLIDYIDDKIDVVDKNVELVGQIKYEMYLTLRVNLLTQELDVEYERVIFDELKSSSTRHPDVDINSSECHDILKEHYISNQYIDNFVITIH